MNGWEIRIYYRPAMEDPFVKYNVVKQVNCFAKGGKDEGSCRVVCRKDERFVKG